MSTASENADLKEKIGKYEQKIFGMCDLIPVDSWGFDEETREKVRKHKHQLVNKQLSEKEKKMLSNNKKYAVARTIGFASTVSEVLEFLSNSKHRPSLELKTNVKLEKPQKNAKNEKKSNKQPQKQSADEEDDSDEEEKATVTAPTKEPTPKAGAKPIATVKPTLRNGVENEVSDEEMDDSTDEETATGKKGGQKRKVAADIKTPAKKSKLDKELEKFENVDPQSLDPIENRHVALLKLQKKLESFKLNRVSKKDNQSAKAAEQLEEKKLKRRMSKLQLKQRRAETKQKSQSDPGVPKTVKAEAPVVNEEGKVVYSKFDFIIKDPKKRLSKSEKKEKFTGKDYRSLLHKAEKRDEKLKELKETDPEKAKEMEQEIKWNRAMKKAEGVKVKDNVELLKKGLRKKEKAKDKRLSKWDQRVKKVDSDKQKRQEKRTENLKKRVDDKKKKTLAKMRKKGRIL